MKASPIAASLAGWEAPENGRLVCQSVICRAPLPEQVRELSLPLAGLELADLPVPDSLTDEDKQAALVQKDPIQTRCYTRANHSDTTIERCLQACPL